MFESVQLLCVELSSNRANSHEVRIFSLISSQRAANKHKVIIYDYDGINLTG